MSPRFSTALRWPPTPLPRLATLDWIWRPGLGLERTHRRTVTRADLAAIDTLTLPRGGRLVLELAPDTCLHRALRLPRAGLRHAAKLAEVELRQTLPLQGRDLDWRLGPPRIDGDIVHMTAHIVKTAHLGALTRRATQCGARLLAIRLADHPAVPPFRDMRGDGRGAALGWGALAALVPLCVVATLGAADWRALQGARADTPVLRQQMQTLADAAVARRRDMADSQEQTARGLADLRRIVAARGRLALLGQLAQIAGDDTWLAEATLNASTLRLSGWTGGDVADLLTAVQGLDAVQRAQLDGPVSRDSRTGQARFDVLVELRAPGADP